MAPDDGWKNMDKVNLLLRAYYELLYEKLQGNRDIALEKAGGILSDEILRRGPRNFYDEKFAAYREVCTAFIDERIEAYNPTGVQYTFDNIRSRLVYDLEMQLDWYDSRAEFVELLTAARKKCEDEMSDERIHELAEELIEECGAFPDTSIISSYEKEPALSKLPDYVAARAIEEIVM